MGVCTAATIYEGVIQMINNHRHVEADKVSNKGKDCLSRGSQNQSTAILVFTSLATSLQTEIICIIL